MSRLEQILFSIDTLKKDLENLQPFNSLYQQKLDKKFRLEFNYNSNNIEGNTLTYGETELLLIFDKTTGNHEMREYEEMKSHDVAFEMIKEWSNDKERPLNETEIKNLHKLLLVRPYWKNAITEDGNDTRKEINVGTYKIQPNSVRLQNGEIFHYTSPQDTPIQMGELVNWFKEEEEKQQLHPLALAALLHYKFVRIHPFDDGNGRISRLLMNYVLIKNNFPPIVIKSERKKDYLFALNQADTGDLDAFVSYLGEQLIWSLNLSIKAAKGENIDETGDLEKKISLLKKKIGVDKDAKVDVTYSMDAITSVFSDVLITFGTHLDKKIELLDTLLESRSIEVVNEKKNRTSERLVEDALGEFYNLFVFENAPRRVKSKNIQVSCHIKILIPNSLKSTPLTLNLFQVSFHDHLYTISDFNEKIIIKKLYNERLTEYESSSLVDIIMNELFDSIQAKIEEEKLNQKDE